MSNRDDDVVAGFGDEWTRFDQATLGEIQRRKIFEEYFAIFPQHFLLPESYGADFGCGSGRWAMMIAPRVGRIACIDASGAALTVARRNLRTQSNCDFFECSIDSMPIEDRSLDFGYSLGVLHHVPDTAAGIASCVKKLKPGAPFLIYLYYRFDNRPRWYSWLWTASERLRRLVSKRTLTTRYFLSQVLASCVYWPLARVARLLRYMGIGAKSFPLSYYADKSFYVMRTDALDRFGTKLEQRFTRVEIQRMLEAAGLERIRFGDRPPFWCAVGYRRQD